MIHPLRRICGLEGPDHKDPYVETLESIDTRQLVHIKHTWKRYLPRIIAYTTVLALFYMFLVQLFAYLIDYVGNATPELLDALDDLSFGTFAICMGFLIGVVSMYSVLDSHLQKRLDEAEKAFFMKDKP